MKAKILKAVKAGNKITRDIIPAIGAESDYRGFCLAIVELQIDGKIELRKDGYYIV